MSFLYYRYAESGSPWSAIGLLSDRNNNAKGIRVGGSYANEKFMIGVNNSRTIADHVLSTNKAQFIVSKIVFNEGGSTNDNVYSMVYNEGDTVTSSEPVTWQYSKTGMGIPADELRFIYTKIESPCDKFVFDDFRIGETWADVADAPALGTVIVID